MAGAAIAGGKRGGRRSGKRRQQMPRQTRRQAPAAHLGKQNFSIA
jgi:hypothetical protein